jgi:hypothetical protein
LKNHFFVERSDHPMKNDFLDFPVGNLIEKLCAFCFTTSLKEKLLFPGSAVYPDELRKVGKWRDGRQPSECHGRFGWSAVDV